MAAASTGEDVEPYTPVKLASSKKTLIKAMVVSLEATNSVMPSPLFADPKLDLDATLAIFKATLDSQSVLLKDKEQVTNAGDYLAK